MSLTSKQRALGVTANPSARQLPPADSSAWIRPDVLVQPPVQRRRGAQEAHHVILGVRGTQPRRNRPVPPADQAITAQQLDPGMAAGVSARSALEGLPATHLQPP